MTHHSARWPLSALTVAVWLTASPTWASDMVRPVRVRTETQNIALQQVKQSKPPVEPVMAAAAAPKYTKAQMEAAANVAESLEKLNKLSSTPTRLDPQVKEMLDYKKAQDDAAVAFAAKAANDQAVVEATRQIANGPDPKCNATASDPNKNKCSQLGATGVMPEVALTTAKSSQSATIKVYKAYLNTGGDTYRPLWISSTLAVKGPIKKDAVVQALLSPDAGLINIATTPLKADDGEYIRSFNHEKDGFCGFVGKPENGCFGYVKMGLKAIQAPVNNSNDYARPLMAYVSTGAFVNLPLYANRNHDEPNVGNLSLGLSGMFGMVNAKKLDYVFGERINSKIGAVIFDASFKLTDVVSAAYSSTVKSYPEQIGRTHSFTLTMATK